MSSGSAVARAFAPALARSLRGSPGAGANCLHRRHLKDGGSSDRFLVRG